MKKFWRSGMIDKKVVKEQEREETEYINKLERVILELTREEEPKYAIVHTSDNRSHKVKIADDYDEIRKDDNVILDFGEDFIIAAPRERLKDSMFNAYSRWLRNRGPYDSDLKFEKQTFGEVEDENNTRDIRQEE